MKAKPYIGITGFKTDEEISSTATLFSKYGFHDDAEYTAMFGLLIGTRGLTEKDVPGKRSPAFLDLVVTARNVPENMLPMIHYFTRDQRRMVDDVKEVFFLDGMYDMDYCSAIQLNVVWPELAYVNRILQEFPELKVVLQLPGSAMGDLSVEEIAGRASEYDDLVRYTLIDPSGGKGIPFDVGKSTELMIALSEYMPNTCIGVAGGFNPDNVEGRVKVIKRQFSDLFFIDAEKNLRVDDQSVLDMEKVEKYIGNTSRAFY